MYSIIMDVSDIHQISCLKNYSLMKFVNIIISNIGLFITNTIIPNIFTRICENASPPNCKIIKIIIININIYNKNAEFVKYICLEMFKSIIIFIDN